jgi:hypothetical protein
MGDRGLESTGLEEGAGAGTHLRGQRRSRHREAVRLLTCPSSLAVAVALALLLLLPSAASATLRPGKITENLTLTAEGSPYTGGEVAIEAGATVTAQPGVTVSVSKLTVNGTLSAVGTAESPILFSKGENPGVWTGTIFNAGSGASVLNHVEVRYAGYGFKAGIEIAGGAGPTIVNSTIAKNQLAGIKVTAGGASEIANDTSAAMAARASATSPVHPTPAKSASTTT